jgi:hypothetical protein
VHEMEGVPVSRRYRNTSPWRSERERAFARLLSRLRESRGM